MISNQIIQNSIEELKSITKIDFGVFNLNGICMASTFETSEEEKKLVINFAASPADSQVVGPHHLLKVMYEEEANYVLDAKSLNDDAYMMGRVAVCHLQNLMTAYRERFDRNNFFQNLLLDNLLLVDIYNRAKQLHIADQQDRIVYIVESRDQDEMAVGEMMKGMFSPQNGDYVTTVDENSVILVKALEEDAGEGELEKIAKTIMDTINAEAMINVRVSFGTTVSELKDVSKSYKEAKMASNVGRIFYQEKQIISYRLLGIGRLIYQLPVNLCRMYIHEIFGEDIPEEIDDETLMTVEKFFENNLNVSETSRQLFIHRNTLVYRFEKLQKATGLDIRVFDDALTLKIALMVVNYINYLEEKTN
ncbi:MAG: helix-turn-helix domain-containing protein [Lachnospiraceae bacterium]|nr:helix-turn-helix domain-containing protein [Lachnospiraceae bacterium]